MKHPRPELMMTLHITPNEVIAINVAINYYLRYYPQDLPFSREMRGLLDQYLDRLNGQVVQESGDGPLDK